ncbi:unnamed protein product [Peniophora sp. CBMAI 1063]|nr:unnamed protein product [Peniophora sp. CBMAI 1063]
MSIGFKNTRNVNSSSSSASSSTSKSTSNLWKVRTPSSLAATQSRKDQHQAVQDALLAKQRATAAAARLRKAQAQPHPGKVIAVRVPKPQPVLAKKQLLKPSLAPLKTKGKSKHDPRAQDAARQATLKLKQQVKATHTGSNSPVRSVIRLDALGNQRIVLIMQRAVVQEALQKSPRLVTAELRTSPDGLKTNVLRFNKTFYGNALVNGVADQLNGIDLSGVSTEERLEDCTSGFLGLDLSAPSSSSKYADDTPLEPIYLDEDNKPVALFADDDEPASPHGENDSLAWNSAFNTRLPTQQHALPPAPAKFSTAVRSGRVSEWHRGAERFTPYASSRPRRIAVA